MRRLTILLTLVSSIGCLGLFAGDGFAHGRRRGCGRECVTSCCESTCNGCEQRTVTCYRAEQRTREVQVTVYKSVPHEEKFTYIECVPVTKPVKRTETFCRTVTREVPCTYTVCVPVVHPEKRTITCYTTVAKQVPHTYTVCVPVTTYEKRLVTRYTSVPRTVECDVPCRTCGYDGCDGGCGRRLFRRGCRHQCDSDCGNYGSSDACCTEVRHVQRTVYDCVPQQVEVTVPVCNWKTEQRAGMRIVCERVPQTREITVNVCSYETQQRTGKRLVCETVPETREVTCNVTTYQRVEKTGTRTVYQCVPVTETRKVTYCEMVPYTATVSVPVCQ